MLGPSVVPGLVKHTRGALVDDPVALDLDHESCLL